MLLQKRCLMFLSKHLPKDYVFKHSTFYTRDTIKREKNLPLLPNSLNLLLVSLWGKVVSPWASSTSASTSFCPWSSASISSWAWSPSHGQCDFILHIHTPLFNIHTSYNYTRVIQMMLYYLMLGLAPHGMDLGFLGLGLLGLGPSWAWAFLGLGLIFWKD